MSRYRVDGTSLLVLTVAATLIGCDPGVDSWADYKGGGLYAGGTPSLAPDNTTIVYASPRSGRGDIYRVDSDGTNRARLTTSDDFEAQPIYSRDGTAIVYVREKDGFRHIWSMHSDGSDQVQLTSGQVFDDMLSFSPDGLRIWFWRSKPTGGRGLYPKLYLMDVVGQNVRQHPASAVSPAQSVSPDGGTLLYTVRSLGADVAEIWAMDAEGANGRRIGSGYSPRYSVDGSTIYYIRYHELFRMNADGSASRRIPTPPGYMSAPRPSWDGKNLLVAITPSGETVGEMYRVDLETLEFKEIASMK